MLGAALVTIAAFGVVFAHRAAQRAPEHRYLVVTSEVSAGSPISAGQLGSVAIDLPESVDSIPAQRAEDVIGRLAAHTLAPSALLSEADLLERDRFAIPGETEVAVSLDPARAPMGRFRAGDTVTLVATDESGSAQVTNTARITHLDTEEDGSIGSVSQVRVGLAVPDGDTALAVIEAAVNTELTMALTAPGQGGTP